MSLRRVYGFTDMANVVRAGAVQSATSEEVLKDNIVRYLNDPTLDREGRRKIVAQQFGRIDGQSTERTLEAISELWANSQFSTVPAS